MHKAPAQLGGVNLNLYCIGPVLGEWTRRGVFGFSKTTPLLRGNRILKGTTKSPFRNFKQPSGMLGVLLDGSLSSKDGACRG